MIEETRWYVISTAPNAEAEVHKQLLARGYESFFPHYREWVGKGKHRSRLQYIALFTGYTFVGFTHARCNAIEVNELCNERGDRISRMVCLGVDARGYRLPFPIPAIAIARIKGRMRCDRDGQIPSRPSESETQIDVGDRVQVREQHALFGFFAMVEERMPNGKELRVLLEKPLLGKDEMIIDEANVEAVEKRKGAA